MSAVLQIFSFGDVLADLGGTGEDPCSVQAHLKFTNATKVSSTVHFSVMPEGKSNNLSQYPMSVSPKRVEIAPHEHDFVSITFNPRDIIPYSANFQARVENGDGNPETQEFSCILQVCNHDSGATTK